MPVSNPDERNEWGEQIEPTDDDRRESVEELLACVYHPHAPCEVCTERAGKMDEVAEIEELERCYYIPDKTMDDLEDALSTLDRIYREIHAHQRASNG